MAREQQGKKENSSFTGAWWWGGGVGRLGERKQQGFVGHNRDFGFTLKKGAIAIF